jgi:hypothetical protein
MLTSQLLLLQAQTELLTLQGINKAQNQIDLIKRLQKWRIRKYPKHLPILTPKQWLVFKDQTSLQIMTVINKRSVSLRTTK